MRLTTCQQTGCQTSTFKLLRLFKGPMMSPMFTFRLESPRMKGEFTLPSDWLTYISFSPDTRLETGEPIGEGCGRGQVHNTILKALVLLQNHSVVPDV